MGETTNFCLSTHAQRRRFQLDPLVDTKLRIQCTCVHHFAQFTHFECHCMHTRRSQRNSIHLQFCNSTCVQLAKQGLREGKGTNAQCLQLPNKMKQPSLVENLVCKQHLLSFCCCIFSLQEAYMDLSVHHCCPNAHNAEQTLKRVTHDGANVACRFSTFRWPT